MSENEGLFKKRALQVAHREEEPHSHGATGMQGWIEPLVIPLSELNKIIEDAKQEFYTVWNNAYGSSAQQGIDIYNKWFLKFFGEK